MRFPHRRTTPLRRLPPLSGLRVFEAVARLGSVTRAAEELGRTHGAVSRQIRALQDEIGFPLFEKAGTGLRPNHSGAALRQVVAEALDGLQRGWQRVADDARGPGVHVACSATFAMRWLVPRLPGFYRDHPDIRLRLSMTTARELRHEGADLVIAWDRTSYPVADRARAAVVAPVAFGPVCAPGYPIAVRPGGPCFESRIGHEHTVRSWELWQDAAGQQAAWTTELRFPHTHLCIEAATAGLGVALVERRLVRDDLVAGRLVAPCGFTECGEGLAAIPTSERAASVAAKAFVAWLRVTMAAAG